MAKGAGRSGSGKNGGGSNSAGGKSPLNGGTGVGDGLDQIRLPETVATGDAAAHAANSTDQQANPTNGQPADAGATVVHTTVSVTVAETVVTPSGSASASGPTRVSATDQTAVSIAATVLAAATGQGTGTTEANAPAPEVNGSEAQANTAQAATSQPTSTTPAETQTSLSPATTENPTKFDIDSFRIAQPVELAPGLTVKLLGKESAYLLESISGSDRIAIKIGYSRPEDGLTGDAKLLAQLKHVLDAELDWKSFDASNPLAHAGFVKHLSAERLEVTISGYQSQFTAGHAVTIKARNLITIENTSFQGSQVNLQTRGNLVLNGVSASDGGLTIVAKAGEIKNSNIKSSVVLRGDLGEMVVDASTTFAPTAPTAYLKNVTFSELTAATKSDVAKESGKDAAKNTPSDLEAALAAFKKRNAGFAYHEKLAPTIFSQATLSKIAKQVTKGEYEKHLKNTFKTPTTPITEIARATVKLPFVERIVTEQFVSDHTSRLEAIRKMDKTVQDDIARAASAAVRAEPAATDTTQPVTPPTSAPAASSTAATAAVTTVPVHAATATHSDPTASIVESSGVAIVGHEHLAEDQSKSSEAAAAAASGEVVSTTDLDNVSDPVAQPVVSSRRTSQFIPPSSRRAPTPIIAQVAKTERSPEEAVASPAADSTAPGVASTHNRKWLLWTGIGVTAAAIALGAVALFRGGSNKPEPKQDDTKAPLVDQPKDAPKDPTANNSTAPNAAGDNSARKDSSTGVEATRPAVVPTPVAPTPVTPAPVISTESPSQIPTHTETVTSNPVPLAPLSPTDMAAPELIAAAGLSDVSGPNVDRGNWNQTIDVTGLVPSGLSEAANAQTISTFENSGTGNNLQTTSVSNFVDPSLLNAAQTTGDASQSLNTTGNQDGNAKVDRFIPDGLR